MKLIAYTRCNKCGKMIAKTEQKETEMGSVYITTNEDCRFIDKWGFARNFCKDCIK